jgi:nicotinamidase-related amidase
MQVMVVDMNVGFSQRGNLYSPRVGALIEPMIDFLSSLSKKDRVVFLTDCHLPDDSELKRFPSHCILGSGEEIIRPELISACKKSYIKYDMFGKTEYDAFVNFTKREANILYKFDKNWIVIGCVTDICVESNVAALVMRGQNVTVVRNLIDTYDAPNHNADEINNFWFEHRFPDIWGCKVVDDWKELV